MTEFERIAYLEDYMQRLKQYMNKTYRISDRFDKELKDVDNYVNYLKFKIRHFNC